MALLSWIWKLETSFVKNSNHLQRSLHAFHVQTDDSRVIHCFENGWSSDSHEYLRHLGKGQNVSRGHNILIFLIKRSKEFSSFVSPLDFAWEKSQNVSLIQSNKGSYCFGFIIWYALELEYVENELKVRCQQLMNINWLIFLSFFLISLCLNCFMSSFSSILREKPYKDKWKAMVKGKAI